MNSCDHCKAWVGPGPKSPEIEQVMLSRGLTRDGECHLYPKPERVPANHWCLQFKLAPAQIAVPEVI